MDTILKFGKFKGQKLSETPSWYQEWLPKQDWYKPAVSANTTSEEKLARNGFIYKYTDAEMINFEKIGYKSKNFFDAITNLVNAGVAISDAEEFADMNHSDPRPDLRS
jgi:hypothetical protein